ncbi:MAG: hypothetical protein L0Z46_08300 [Nitrospiraceae bacterium]|nr:hypothetical protein [Nitrospiraceae bacterium]
MAGYGRMAATDCASIPAITYRVEREANEGSFCISRDGACPLISRNDADFLFLFEKDLSIELQYQRPDLFFVHAAVVERQGKAVILAAPSGTGKSTLTLALLHAGFRYLSDELAPLDLSTLQVMPYPHALCLKAEPPEPFELPKGAIRTLNTIHIPTRFLPATALSGPVPIAAVFFIHRGGDAGPKALLREVGSAQAAVRLYANALNALAHSGDGLDAAVRIALSAPCYELDSTDLVRVGPAIESLIR